MHSSQNLEVPRGHRDQLTSIIPVPVSAYALSESVAVGPERSSERLSALAETPCESQALARPANQVLRAPPSVLAEMVSRNQSASQPLANEDKIIMSVDRPVASNLPIGLQFGTNAESRLCVKHIAEDSIFAHNNLQKNMVILRINGFTNLTVQEVTKLITSIHGTITIVASLEPVVKQSTGQNDLKNAVWLAELSLAVTIHATFTEAVSNQNTRLAKSSAQGGFATLVDTKNLDPHQGSPQNRKNGNNESVQHPQQRWRGVRGMANAFSVRKDRKSSAKQDPTGDRETSGSHATHHTHMTLQTSTRMVLQSNNLECTIWQQCEPAWLSSGGSKACLIKFLEPVTEVERPDAQKKDTVHCSRSDEDG